MLGLALVKLKKEIWEKVFPEHTHLGIFCPLSIGTITKHNHGDLSGIRGDTSTAINFPVVFVSASGTALPYKLTAEFPPASLQEKAVTCWGSVLFFKKCFSAWPLWKWCKVMSSHGGNLADQNLLWGQAMWSQPKWTRNRVLKSL